MRRPAFAGASRDPETVAADLEALPSRPLISVAMPTYETAPHHLRDAIWSVATQEYPNWELVIVDDGSTNRSALRELARWDARDERIVVRMLDRNSGISAATNQAIEHCRGELIASLTTTPRHRGRAVAHGARVRRRGNRYRLLGPGTDHDEGRGKVLLTPDCSTVSPSCDVHRALSSPVAS